MKLDRAAVVAGFLRYGKWVLIVTLGPLLLHAVVRGVQEDLGSKLLGGNYTLMQWLEFAFVALWLATMAFGVFFMLYRLVQMSVVGIRNRM